VTVHPQTRLLTRTFFGRMFESDLMPQGLPQVQLVTGVIAFLAAPALLLPLLLAKKYVWLAGHPDLMRASIAQDRTLALLLAMLATTMITMVIWENIFPDRRDSRNLGVLPIAERRFVVARLTAIVALFALVFGAGTLLESVSFAIVQANFSDDAPGALVLAANLITVGGAAAVVFFGILAAQCAVLSIAGPDLAHRIAVIVQIIAVVLVLQMPLLLPGRDLYIASGGVAPPWTQTPAAWALPPLWFLSLYELIATGQYEETRRVAYLTAAAVVAVPVAALTFYAASYRRLTRLAIEGRPSSGRRPRLGIGRMQSLAVRLFARVPVRAAVCTFTLRTLARSRQHRMLMAIWVGLAFACIISGALPLLVRHGWGALSEPRAAILVAPLILAALTQAGMRSLFAIPTEIKANWVFRLNEPRRLPDAIAGASASLIVAGVVPPVLLAFVSGWMLWGIAVGIMHAAFCGVLGVLLAQLLTRSIDKVPFTCTYLPGKGNLSKLWPAYLTAFSLYTYTMAALEEDLLASTAAYAWALAAFTALAATAAWSRSRNARQLVNLRFQEEPADAVTVVTIN
jgi:hypothetical protein